MTDDKQPGRGGRVFLWAIIVASALALAIVVRALWGQIGRVPGTPPVVAGGRRYTRSATSWYPGPRRGTRTRAL